MKTAPRKKAKTRYVKDENPELGKAAALRNFLKQSVARVKETVNSWGVPTFETDLAFSVYMVGKKSDSTREPRSRIQKGCSKVRERTCDT